MSEATPDFVAILGGATPPGRLRSALEAGLNGAGLDPAADLIDLADVSIGPAGVPPAEGNEDDTHWILDRIATAQTVLIASPIYRGSITGTLKNLLDLVPVAGLRRTVVATVTMGGSDHHYLGADRHLRDILTFFGAATLPNSLYLTPSDFTDGQPGEETVEAVIDVIDSARGFGHALAPLDSWGTPPLFA